MSYIIETRTPETDERAAGPWHSDGMGEVVEYSSEAAAEAAIAELRRLGPDWAAADYRVVPRRNEATSLSAPVCSRCLDLAPGAPGLEAPHPGPFAEELCAPCGLELDRRPVRAWIGTPPPGWSPGDPRPHICRATGQLLP